MSARGHQTVTLPNWPAMMDLDLAAAYTTLGVDGFRSLASRYGVRPVDLGTSNLRWRKADLDRLVDKLPLREPKLTAEQARESPVLAVVESDPAAEGLERIRRRARR